MIYDGLCLHGGFLKWGYPWIIHFRLAFPLTKTIQLWGIPVSGNPHLDWSILMANLWDVECLWDICQIWNNVNDYLYLSMVYVWDMCGIPMGIYIGYVWDRYGICMGMYGISVGYLWDIYGICMGYMICMDIYGTCVKFYGMSMAYLWDIWDLWNSSENGLDSISWHLYKSFDTMWSPVATHITCALQVDRS